MLCHSGVSSTWGEGGGITNIVIKTKKIIIEQFVAVALTLDFTYKVANLGGFKNSNNMGVSHPGVL